MTYKKSISYAAHVMAGIVFLAGSALPAFAQTSTTTPAATAVSKADQKIMGRMVSRANQEIDRRVARLSELVTRVQSMKKLSDSDKTSIVAAIQSQITNLNNLKAKIAADTDVATLRSDVKSITDSYRIYALFIPQISMVATIDRLLTTIDTLSAIGVKLQARIAAAQSAGKDVSAAQTTLVDYSAKLADAAAKAQVALSEVAALVPDQGDKAKAEANRQALKDARSKIKTAMDDLKTAHRDAASIAKAIKGLGLGVSASSTVPAVTP